MNKALKVMPSRHNGLVTFLHMLKNVSQDRQILDRLHVVTSSLIDIGLAFVRKDEFKVVCFSLDLPPKTPLNQ